MKEIYMEELFTPDKIDWKILGLLQENAYLPIKEIAKQINLTITPVHNRIKRLERSGIIEKYIAKINEEKAGYTLVALCYITLHRHSTAAGTHFIKTVRNWAEVTECLNISGEYDFLLRVCVKDMKAYQQFYVQKIGELENIGRSHTVFVMGKIK